MILKDVLKPLSIKSGWERTSRKSRFCPVLLQQSHHAGCLSAPRTGTVASLPKGTDEECLSVRFGRSGCRSYFHDRPQAGE